MQNAVPHATQTSGGKYHAFLAFRLRAIGVAPENDGSRRQAVAAAMAGQVQLLSAFSSLGSDVALEFRFTKVDSGRVEVLLRARQSACDKSELPERVELLFASIWPNLVGVSEDYQWEQVADSATYARLFASAELRFHHAIARRELILRLDTDAAPRRSVGFATSELQQQVSDPSNPTVCLISPFRRTESAFDHLFRVLMMVDAACTVSIAITPTRIFAAESEFMHVQTVQCERFCQLPFDGPVSAPDSFIPPLKSRAAMALRTLEQMSMTQTDELFAMRIQLSSSAAIPAGIVDAVASSLTQPPVVPPEAGAPLLQDPLLCGGSDTFAAETAEQAARAKANLDDLSFDWWYPSALPDSVVRLRSLVGVHEASAAFRLPLPIAGRFPGLETMLSKYIVCDTALPENGLLLGHNTRLGAKFEVRLTEDDRRRHAYVVGQTGTGKTTLLMNMILQDIEMGRGVAVFDPHGDLIDKILERMPAARRGDVIHYDPSDTRCDVAINLFDCSDEVDRDRAVNHLLEMFNAFYDMREAGGPLFELYFRNAALLLAQNTPEPGTIMDMQRLFADEEFRKDMIARCRDEQIRQFWKGAIDRTGDNSIENLGFYITSKLNRLANVPTLRPLLSKPRSSVDLLQVMSDRRIVLLDLHKGFLGNLNCSMLGALWISLIERATFRREISGARPPANQFNLYVDEFQQFAFESFVSLLAEARKFGLNITLANQYLDQVPQKVLDAVIGNVGTLITFRIGQKDAERLRNLFVPTVSDHDLTLLPNYRAYIKTLARGQALLPFSLEAAPLPALGG